MSRFRVSGIGLDLGTVDYELDPKITGRYDYFYTRLSDCNEFYVSGLVKSQGEAELIIELPFVTEPVLSLLRDHLKAFGRERADIILITDLGKTDMKKLEELKYYSARFGLNNPGRVDDIEVLRKVVGEEEAKYIALDVSPLKFDYDLITRCHGLGLDLIGRNGMSGYLNHPVAINSFSVPYLLSFSAMYCEIPILSGRDIYLSGRDRDFMEQLKGERTESDIFNLTGNVNRLSQGLDKFVYTSLNLSDVLRLDYNDPGKMFGYSEVSLRLTGTEEDQYLVDTLRDNDISNILKVLEYPGEDYLDLAMAYYKVKDYVKLKYPESDKWEVSFYKMADRVIGVKAVKTGYDGWLIRKRVDDGVNMFIYKSPDTSEPYVLTDKNHQ